MSRQSTSKGASLLVGCAAVALTLCAAPERAAAQATIAEFGFAGAGTASGFGGSIAGLGDVNGDGHDDFVTGAPNAGAGGQGVVQILSGADHSVIREWTGDSTGDLFGSCVDRVGDVDGDGVADVIIGAPGLAQPGPYSGVVRVYSSGTGALLYQIPALGEGDSFGKVVAGLGDLDRDGRADFAAATPFGHTPGGEANAGYVRFVSGADGHELAIVFGAAEELLGFNVRPAGDFDADGTPDVVITTGLVSSTSFPHVRVYSGASIAGGGPPALLLDLSDSAFSPDAVDAAGDVDRDGWDDLLVGTPFTTPSPPHGGFRVISGRDHSVLLSWLAGATDYSAGANVAGAGDVDQDGYPDLLVGSGDGMPFLSFPVRVFSGRDGALLYTCEPPHDTTPFGAALAGVGDVNADGFPDWAVGSPWRGAIALYSPAAIWTDLGHGLAGAAGVPALSGAGPLLGGDAMSLALAGALPAHPLVLVAGLSAVSLPFKGGVMLPHPDLLSFTTTGADGTRQWNGTWPRNVPAMSFYFQAWLEDPQGVAGWAASNGLRAQAP